MTGVEKLGQIDEIMKSAGQFGLGWKEAEMIQELRKDIKVSDWFIWSGEADTSLEKFYKMMGFDNHPLGRINQKLNQAIDQGFVKMYDYKQHGRYFWRIKLTAKGKKLLHV